MEFTKRQKEIIKVSLRLMAKKGIQGFTIKNLSKAIGVSEPAIYRHFESKLEILISILNLFKEKIDRYYDSVLINKEMGACSKIEAIIKKHFEEFSRMPELAYVIFSEEMFRYNETLSAIVNRVMNENIERLTNLIREGQKKGEIRGDIEDKKLSIIILGSLRLTIKLWSQNSFQDDLERKGEELKDAILKLIKEIRT